MLERGGPRRIDEAGFAREHENASRSRATRHDTITLSGSLTYLELHLANRMEVSITRLSPANVQFDAAKRGSARQNARSRSPSARRARPRPWVLTAPRVNRVVGTSIMIREILCAHARISGSRTCGRPVPLPGER